MAAIINRKAYRIYLNGQDLSGTPMENVTAFDIDESGKGWVEYLVTDSKGDLAQWRGDFLRQRMHGRIRLELCS